MADTKTKMIDVIIPVFNEEEILAEFHRRMTAVDLPLNLIYVDNCSSDRSVDIIKNFEGITLIEHDRNEGYGGSLLDGIAHSENDLIVIIDADCEYPPEAVTELVKRLETEQVVFTSRFLEGRNRFMPWPKRLGNQLISSFFNILFGQKVTDLYTGCKAFHRSALDGVELTRKGFEHVLELAVKFSRKGLTIAEISIDFTPRHTGQAKMQHVSETLKYLFLTIYYFFTVRKQNG